MKKDNFKAKIKDIGITTVDILNKLIEKGIITSERFPHLFNGDTFLMKLDDTAELKKGYKTCCPEPPERHQQSNGDSFHIYEDNVFCFGGCYKGLEIIDLVVYFINGNISLAEASDWELTKGDVLKAKVFIAENFPELGIAPASLSNPEKYKWDTKQKILQLTAEYYHFVGKKSKKLKEYYLESRWFKYGKKSYEELFEECMLGITPKGKYDEKTKRTTHNALYLYLKKKGFSDKDILDSSLCRRNSEGQFYDFFRDRAIIPYFYRGKVIGMYGRSFDPKCEKQYRHLRLEGAVEFPSSLDDVIKSKEFFLVEGENTKIAVKACGYDNVMETRGTNGMRKEHYELLARHREYNPEMCETVYMCFDTDENESGRKGTLTVGQKLLEKGIKVMVVRIPPIRVKEKVDGELKEITVYPDVNDLFRYYKEKAPEIFQSYVDKAISFDAFALLHNLEKEKITNLAEGRMALKRNAKYLNGIPRLERRFIVAEIADYLYPAFKSVGLSMDELMQDLRDLWINAQEEQTKPTQTTVVDTPAELVKAETTPVNNQSLPPIEGGKESKECSLSFVIATKQQDIYNKIKPQWPHLLLVRDVKFFELTAKEQRKDIIFDQTFEFEEIAPFLDMSHFRTGKGILRLENGVPSLKKPQTVTA